MDASVKNTLDKYIIITAYVIDYVLYVHLMHVAYALLTCT